MAAFDSSIQQFTNFLTYMYKYLIKIIFCMFLAIMSWYERAKMNCSALNVCSSITDNVFFFKLWL